MKRKIYDEFVKWKNDSAGKTALLIDGARRVGKSFIAEEFAKAEYKSYIIIDFNRVGKDIKDLFENYLDDIDTLFLLLSEIYDTKLYERESLFIFD
jgi:AAA+ ATPase superfamily predicted ATPase